MLRAAVIVHAICLTPPHLVPLHPRLPVTPRPADLPSMAVWCGCVVRSLVSVFMRNPPAYAGLNAWTTNGPAVPFIQAVAVDTTNPDIVYAATSRGVFKTTNGGLAWAAVKTGLVPIDEHFALSIDPSDSDIVYVGAQKGVFKSTNGGATWTAMNAGRTNVVRSFAMDPTHSDFLYAGTQGGVFKSINAGATWAEMNTGLTRPVVLAFAVAPGGMNLYAGTIDGGVFLFQSVPVPIPTLP